VAGRDAPPARAAPAAEPPLIDAPLDDDGRSTRPARYSRHLLTPKSVWPAKKRLSRGRVLVVGAGGLGSPVLAISPRPGVGRILVIDDDTVDVTNCSGRSSTTPAMSARRRQSAPPHGCARSTRRSRRRTADSVRGIEPRELVRLVDVVVDGSDTFATRYLVNDACCSKASPTCTFDSFVSTSVSVFGAPAVRAIAVCILSRRPSIFVRRARGGVLGVWPDGRLVPSERAITAVGIGTPLIGAYSDRRARARVREYALARDPACPLCGDAPTIREVQRRPGTRRAGIDGSGARLDAFDARCRRAIVLDVREPHDARSRRGPRRDRDRPQPSSKHACTSSYGATSVACRVGAK